jgi:hypothetical protein
MEPALVTWAETVWKQIAVRNARMNARNLKPIVGASMKVVLGRIPAR